MISLNRKLLLSLIITAVFSTVSYAYVIQYNAGDYEMPLYNSTFADHNIRDNVDLTHDYFYIWCLNDLSQVEEAGTRSNRIPQHL